MEKQDEEYKYLRKEIESCISIVQKTIQMLYVSITVVIAWAIDVSNPLICLAAYCVIIPTYFITIDYNISMLKIGAYLYVFFDDYKWEKRLHVVNCKKVINRHDNSYKYPFVFSSAIVFAMFLILFDWDINNLSLETCAQMGLNLLLFFGFNIYIYFQKCNDDVKQVYINNWQEIKAKENTKKNN